MAKNALQVAGVVFGLVALLHLSRFLLHFDLMIGMTLVPVWVNGVGFVVASFLAFLMFNSNKNL